MKIGILTLPQETNYGGILQAFALQKVLRDMGNNAITIDRHRRKEYPSLMIHLAGYFKRLFQYFILRKKTVSVKWNPFSTEDFCKKKSERIQQFLNRNVRLTRRIYPDQLPEIDEEYQFDAYVVGSDQVWLDYYCPNSFLDFVKRPNVKKVFYAASCGKKSFFNNSKKISLCKELVKSFNGVSVREESLVTMCKEKLGVEAKWVLDPTMLLSSKVYLEAIECHVESTPVLFSYILDSNSNKNNIVKTISTTLNLPIVNGNKEKNDREKVFPSVDDWLQNMNRARFVVTDSFHGTVFAILFNKPFISIGNVSRGLNRFDSLLNMFSLKERLITDTEFEKVSSLVGEAIDFNHVNAVLEHERLKSMEFLTSCLI